MSIEAIDWAVEQHLPPIRKLVLMMIAWHVNHLKSRDHCWPNLSTLAAECGMERRTVRRHLAELEIAGLIRREPRERSNQSQTSNLIVLMMDPPGHQRPGPRNDESAHEVEEEPETTTEKEVRTVLTDVAYQENDRGDGHDATAHGDPQNAAAHGNAKNDHAPSPREITAAVDAVWAHYCNVMHPRSNVADSEQRRLIRDALKISPRTASSNGLEGPVAELCRAIDGCAASPFHMGDNDRGKKYNRISNIFKGKRGGRTTREQIDMFLEIAEKAGSQSDVPAASAGRVQAARRDVLDGWEYPSDEVVVARAEEAKAWLLEQGWRIDYEQGTKRPLFTR